MERIKDALEQARRAREKAILESTLNEVRTGGSADVNDLIDARRIRERTPFNKLSAGDQQRLIAAGEVRRFDSAAVVFQAGEADECLHYLLEGAVSIASDSSAPQTLYAYQDAALMPLDDAGTKTHTVRAVIPSRVFRINATTLAAMADVAAPTAPSAPPPAEPEIPRELYTQTYSGDQLAQLVEQLHADRAHLAAGNGEVPKPTGNLDEVRFGENTLGVKLEVPATSINDFDVQTLNNNDTAPTASLPSREEINDEIGRFMRALEGRFRRYVLEVRAEERRRAQAQLQTHAKRLQALAEQQLRTKVETIRERYQTALLAREKKLRERYEHLIAMANKVTRQKAAIYQARRQLEDKLRLAEQVHNELAQIGLTVTRQLNDLEGMIPDEEGAKAED